MTLGDLRRRWLSLAGGLEGVLALLALLGALAVLQTFVLGQHFVIPTALLVPTAFTAVLAVRGAAGQRWAQGIVLWLGVLRCFGRKPPGSSLAKLSCLSMGPCW
ncbi:MAG: hypothetical protein EBU29_02775 [Gammaproteobacteria bacterium]|nr:hypothetical protein [Gammaproteobacteria bacterium]